MADSTTANRKRMREEQPAEDRTSPIMHTDTSSAQEQAPTQSGEPVRKKSKLVHKKPTTADDVEFDTPDPLIRKKTKNIKGKAAQSSPDGDTAADEEMSDADTNNGKAVQQSAAPPPAPEAPAKSKDFNLLPPVLAKDLANNPYAPTDPTALAHYLVEVGDLQLHPIHTPLQTPSSTVSLLLRETMFEKVFCSYTNDECIPTYNKHGGNATLGATVSKTLIPSVPRWFTEEGVVLPFDARNTKERARLKALGLSAANFPTPHKTKVAIAGAAPSKRAKKATHAPKTTVQEAPIQDDAQEEGFGQDVESPAEDPQYNDVQPPYTKSQADDEDVDQEMSDYDDDRSQDADADGQGSEGEESDSEPEPVLVMPRKVARRKRVRTQAEIEDEAASLQYPMRDRLRAAFNLFGKDIITMEIGGVMYRGKKFAFLKHCRALRDGADVTIEPDIPSSIFKAFVATMSPVPRAGLPPLEFDFLEDELDQGMNSEDGLGIMTNDNVDVKEVVWDVDACVQMHKLCVAFDCAIVQDMVVDKLREIYLQHCVEDIRSEFVLPVGYMNDLEDEAEEHFLRILIDIMLDQNEHGIGFPKDIADDLVNWAAERATAKLHSQSSPLHNKTNRGACKHYHSHDADQACYHDLAQEPDTTKMMRYFYHQVDKQASAKHDEIMATLQASNPKHPEARVRQMRLRSDVQTSQSIEEATAGSLFMLELLEKYESKQKVAGKGIAPKYHRAREQHRDKIADWKAKHKKGWYDFDNPVSGSSMWPRERWAGDARGWYRATYDPLTGLEERKYDGEPED